jgi:hypothetical protein
VTYVVRLDGAVIHAPSGRADFAFQEVAELFAAHQSVIAYAGQTLTVHDGDAFTEENVVSVWRDGNRVGPATEDNGY